MIGAKFRTFLDMTTVFLFTSILLSGIIPAAGPIIDVALGVVKVNRKAQKLQ